MSVGLQVLIVGTIWFAGAFGVVGTALCGDVAAWWRENSGRASWWPLHLSCRHFAFYFGRNWSHFDPAMMLFVGCGAPRAEGETYLRWFELSRLVVEREVIARHWNYELDLRPVIDSSAWTGIDPDPYSATIDAGGRVHTGFAAVVRTRRGFRLRRSSDWKRAA